MRCCWFDLAYGLVLMPEKTKARDRALHTHMSKVTYVTLYYALSPSRKRDPSRVHGLYFGLRVVLPDTQPKFVYLDNALDNTDGVALDVAKLIAIEQLYSFGVYVEVVG